MVVRKPHVQSVREEPDRFSLETVNGLIDSARWPAVTILMPTLRATRTNENQIRFKNRVREAAAGLETAGVPTGQIEKQMEPAYRMIEDTIFWSHQNNGLVAFLSPGHFQYFTVPFSLPNRSRIGSGFHLRPLYPLLFEDLSYSLLTLNLDGCRLYEGTRWRLREINFPPAHQGLREHLGYLDREKELQNRSIPQAGSRSGRAGFFGNDLKEELKQADKATYFRFVGEEAARCRRGAQTPLLVAGIESHIALFDGANNERPNELKIAMDVHGLSHDALVEQVRPRIEVLWHKKKSALLSVRNSGERRGQVTNQLKDVLTAAREGRVERIFVDPNAEAWGRFDEETGQLEMLDAAGEDREDLLDRACVQAVKSGAAVTTWSPEESSGERISALLRFKIDQVE